MNITELATELKLGYIKKNHLELDLAPESCTKNKVSPNMIK